MQKETVSREKARIGILHRVWHGKISRMRRGRGCKGKDCPQREKVWREVHWEMTREGHLHDAEMASSMIARSVMMEIGGVVMGVMESVALRMEGVMQEGLPHEHPREPRVFGVPLEERMISRMQREKDWFRPGLRQPAYHGKSSGMRRGRDCAERVRIGTPQREFPQRICQIQKGKV